MNTTKTQITNTKNTAKQAAFRPAKDTTAYFSSLSDLAAAYNIKPYKQKEKTDEVLEAQQKNFAKTCYICKARMNFVKATNSLCCSNPLCKGREVTNVLGEKEYIPSCRVLDEKGTEIAENLFQ